MCPSTRAHWARPSPQLKQHLDQFSHFCTDDRRVSLYFSMGRPFALKIAASHEGIWTPSNWWFPEPTRVLNPNGISIGSAVFAGLTGVTDIPTNRQTDIPLYSIVNNKPHFSYLVLRCGLEMVEPIDFPFGLWTGVGRRKHKLNKRSK